MARAMSTGVAATAPVALFRPSAGAVSVATFTVLPLFLVGALGIQLSRDIGVPVSALGAAPAAFFGAGALASSLAGWVAGRLGARTTMRCSLLLAVLVLVCLGAGVASFAGLLGILVIGGVGNALAQPAVNLYLAQRISQGRQGTAYGIKQSAIPVSGMLAGLAVPLIGLTVGWRWAFVLFALPAAALAFYTPGADGDLRAASRSTAASPLPRKILGVIAVGAGLGAASGSCLGIFLVPGAAEAGWSEAHAGFIFAGASLVGILARMLSGIRADRRGGWHFEAIALMLGIGAVGFIALASSHHLLYGLGAPLAFGLGWGWPGLLILAVVQLSPADAAGTTGLVQIGTSAGAVLGPLVFGLLVEHFSYGLAWSVAGSRLVFAAAVFMGARQLVDRLQAEANSSPPNRSGGCNDDRP